MKMSISLEGYANIATALLLDGTPQGKSDGRKMVLELALALQACQNRETFEGQYLTLGVNE